MRYGEIDRENRIWVFGQTFKSGTPFRVYDRKGEMTGWGRCLRVPAHISNEFGYYFFHDDNDTLFLKKERLIPQSGSPLN